jgi:hypothetical protein
MATYRKKDEYRKINNKQGNNILHVIYTNNNGKKEELRSTELLEKEKRITRETILLPCNKATEDPSSAIPFSFQQEFFKSGISASRGYHKGSFLDGAYETYFPDGVIETKRFFFNRYLCGLQISYWHNRAIHEYRLIDEHHHNKLNIIEFSMSSYLENMTNHNNESGSAFTIFDFWPSGIPKAYVSRTEDKSYNERFSIDGVAKS